MGPLGSFLDAENRYSVSNECHVIVDQQGKILVDVVAHDTSTDVVSSSVLNGKCAFGF